MALLTIRVLGDPILRTPAETVTRFDAALAALVADMHETMVAVGGVGLAAPQVGVGLRVFTWQVDGSEGHVVNPVLTPSDEQQTGVEGCLSVPAIGGHTPRAQRATVTGVDVTGAPVTVTGEGMLARCLQHETDHLDGHLYLDRLTREERRNVMAALRTPEWTVAARRVQDDRLAQAQDDAGPRTRRRDPRQRTAPDSSRAADGSTASGTSTPSSTRSTTPSSAGTSFFASGDGGRAAGGRGDGRDGAGRDGAGSGGDRSVGRR